MASWEVRRGGNVSDIKRYQYLEKEKNVMNENYYWKSILHIFSIHLAGIY